MSMRRCEPIRCNMLPDASRMISTALPAGKVRAHVTSTNPGASFPGVMRIGARASVACDCPVA